MIRKSDFVFLSCAESAAMSGSVEASIIKAGHEAFGRVRVELAPPGYVGGHVRSRMCGIKDGEHEKAVTLSVFARSLDGVRYRDTPACGATGS